MSNSIPARLRRLVIQRSHGICEYCLIHQDDAYFAFHIDHIISRKQLGNTLAANLAVACLRCNVAKGTDPGAYVGHPPHLVRLYHPRLDSWNDHFRLVVSRIHPLTEIGEATIRLLDLNGPDRLLLREALIQSRRYPSVEAFAYLSNQH